jgi:hypothetical protein
LDCEGTILDFREKNKKKKRTKFQLTLERLHTQQQQRAACHCLLFSLFTFSFFLNFSGGLSLEFLNPIGTGAEFKYGVIL